MSPCQTCLLARIVLLVDLKVFLEQDAIFKPFRWRLVYVGFICVKGDLWTCPSLQAWVVQSLQLLGFRACPKAPGPASRVLSYSAQSQSPPAFPAVFHHCCPETESWPYSLCCPASPFKHGLWDPGWSDLCLPLRTVLRALLVGKVLAAQVCVPGRLGSWTVSAGHHLTASHWYPGPGLFLFVMVSHMRVTYNLLLLGSLLW